MIEKTSMKKNLASGINKEKTPKPLSGNIGRKLKRSIDKKPFNPMGTAEENQMIVSALNFFAPESTLKRAERSIHWW